MPRLEGRFPQISGMRFKYDPLAPPGNRIVVSTSGLRKPCDKRVVQSVTVGEGAGAPLEDDKIYTLATRGYMFAVR